MKTCGTPSADVMTVRLASRLTLADAVVAVKTKTIVTNALILNTRYVDKMVVVITARAFRRVMSRAIRAGVTLSIGAFTSILGAC